VSVYMCACVSCRVHVLLAIRLLKQVSDTAHLVTWHQIVPVVCVRLCTRVSPSHEFAYRNTAYVQNTDIPRVSRIRPLCSLSCSTTYKYMCVEHDSSTVCIGAAARRYIHMYKDICIYVEQQQKETHTYAYIYIYIERERA
jgi:hypothetical protein